MVFVDTSALYALLDEEDTNHLAASDALRRLAGQDLVTHAFVIVETAALVGRRLAWGASQRLIDGLLPVVEVSPVDDALYRRALEAFRRSRSARISLVDRTSFAFMRAREIRVAFAFDRDFKNQGFELVA